VRCDDALAMLLDADLAAFAFNAASPLGSHLTECARCRAVANRLRLSTTQVAAALAAHPLPEPSAVRLAPRRRVIVLLPISLVAAAIALIYFAASHGPSAVVVHAVPGATVAVVEPRPAVPASARPAATRVRSTIGVLPVQRRVAATAFTPIRAEGASKAMPLRVEVAGPLVAKSALPVPLAIEADASAADAGSAEGASPVRHGVVLHPRNPNITVVWFY